MFKYQLSEEGLIIDISLPTQFNYVNDNSGIGKSYAANRLIMQLSELDMFRYINYVNITQAVELLNAVKTRKDMLVILDNCDIYMNTYNRLILDTSPTYLLFTRSPSTLKCEFKELTRVYFKHNASGIYIKEQL